MLETRDSFWNNIDMKRQYKKYIWFDKDEIIPIRTLFEIFLNKSIYIDGFASDSQECVGVYLMNKEIFSVDEIDMKNSEVYSNKKVEKYAQIQSINLDEMKQEKLPVFIDEKERFGIQNVGWMREIVRNKKLFIYGLSDRSKKLVAIYELLDFTIEGYIVDEIPETEEKKTLLLEDIIYEEDFFILISREDYKNMAGHLIDLGLQMFEHLGIDSPFGTWYLGTGNQVLDVNLGHSFLGKQGMYGFEVFGNNDVNNMRIFVLGGSTTDGTLFPFKSWPQCLADRISDSNVTVFNGGVVGYTSTQELIKLLRDVLFMKPDMVIVYDGFNDMTAESDQSPFAFKELQRTMDYVDQCKDELWLDSFAENAVPYTGMKPDVDKYEIWLGNIKRMKAVCGLQGIQFYDFLQPVLYSKKDMTKDELGLLWSTWRINDCYQWAKEFRKRIKSAVDSYEYIYDLSHIFDHKDGMYMDDCHVYERGNEIIANLIYEVIKEKLVWEIDNKYECRKSRGIISAQSIVIQ